MRSSRLREAVRWALAAAPLVLLTALLAPRWMSGTAVPHTFSDGTVASAAAVNANFASLVADVDTLAGGVGFTTIVTYDASGTFVVPAGVKRAWVKVWGGGGGGGGASGSWSGNGGGGGGYAEGIYPLTAGDSIAVTVGAKGLGAPAGSSASTGGGTSSFGALLSATGGIGGTGTGSGSVGGVGGMGTGQVTMRGQAGREALYGLSSTYMQGGGGGDAPNGGAGGLGSDGSIGAPGEGGAPGGGGAGGGRSGASFHPGMAGAPGRVVVYY